MARSITSTARFFGHVLRDLGGTFRSRWVRFQRRLAGASNEVVVGVDIFPLTEKMTGVGWYEWNVLKALDLGDDGLTLNLYADTFLAPADPPAPRIPGARHLRLRAHQLPHDLVVPTRPTLALLRRIVEPILRTLDDNDVLWAPNFFATSRQVPFGRALVATVHDLAFAVMPQTVAPETSRELQINLPSTLFHADRLIAVSEATAGDMVEHLETNRRRIHVVHEGIDPGFATLEPPTTSPPDLPDRYLLFVSTLEPRKNVTGVVKAFELVVSWGYQGHLVLVGRWGWRTEGIRRDMEASPVRSRIRHLDYVDRERLPSLYRGADALVFPSWMEGFGLPLLEAMACGAPVVTSGQSAMPEVAGPAAVYVDPASSHGIASAVISLTNDLQHRKRLVDLGKERARRFRWERAAAATAQVLRQAAGRNAPGDDEYRV